jgi:flagellar motor switch protein FliG
MLVGVERNVERAILEKLEHDNQDLAQAVRKLIFVFEDLGKLDNRSLQRVLRDVDYRDLALALRGCDEALTARIHENLSSRAVEMLQDEMSAGGPVRPSSIDQAQQRIVAVVRRLEEAEEIYVSRGDDDAL